MSKYALWDKTSDIYTLGTDPATGKNHYTAEEYISAFAPWAGIPTVKVIVGGGVINGTVFMEFGATKEFYEEQGADFSDCATDEEVVAKIEAFENEMNAPRTEPTAEERIAAALEYQVVSSLPDEV